MKKQKQQGGPRGASLLGPYLLFVRSRLYWNDEYLASSAPPVLLDLGAAESLPVLVPPSPGQVGASRRVRAGEGGAPRRSDTRTRTRTLAHAPQDQDLDLIHAGVKQLGIMAEVTAIPGCSHASSSLATPHTRHCRHRSRGPAK